MRRHRVLVILDKHSAGEALRLRGLAAHIKAARSQSEVVMVVPSRVASFFRTGSDADRVVASWFSEISNAPSMRPRKVGELLRLLYRLGFGYDEVITLGWGSTILDVLARIVGRRTIGHAHRWPWLLDVNVGTYDVEQDLLKQSERTLEAAKIEIRSKADEPGRSSAGDVALVDSLLAAAGLSDESGLVALHTGSDWACQQWQPASWAELADRLVEKRGACVIFTGLQQERDYIEAIRNNMRHESTSLAGRTTLSQLAALLGRCSMCVTVDSGVSEIAQLVDVPTVVLSSPTTTAPNDRLQGRFMVINKTLPDVRATITRCQFRHLNGPIAFTDSCHDYSCPFAGMRRITVDHVEDIISSIEGHATSTPVGLRTT